jgi:N-acetylmuramoyl-L-alanine amidase
MNHSALFAHQIISSVSKETKELLENTHRFAGFAVLKAPDIPSVLIECGYLSNQRDEQMLLNVKYRVKLANAISHASSCCQRRREAQI